MSDNVVGLRGAAIFKAEPDEEVIKAAADALEMAKSGEIVGVSIAVHYRDESTGAWHGGVKSRALVGAMFGLCSRMSAVVDNS